MPPKSKPKGRAFGTNGSSKSSSKRIQDPPAPFKRAPEHLQPLLAELSTNHVYITHIDSQPSDFKRKIFAVPVLMNVGILLAIFWRLKTIGPFYLQILYSLVGTPNETTIDRSQLTDREVAFTILKRAGSLAIDAIIYLFVSPWPWNFFVGRDVGSPVAWRLGVGFQEKEIIVRRSRDWGVGLKDVTIEGSPGQQTLFPIIWKAVDPSYMSEKTGYLMLNSEWLLDWNTILIAAELIEKKDLSMDDFKTTIYVYDEHYGWMVLITAVAGGSAKEEEGRTKITAFKDELTAMGKENLFFKWIELVQFESSGPDGFGPEQQAKTMKKAKAMFEEQGIDFDAFWTKIGGMEGLPGMDR